MQSAGREFSQDSVSVFRQKEQNHLDSSGKWTEQNHLGSQIKTTSACDPRQESLKWDGDSREPDPAPSTHDRQGSTVPTFQPASLELRYNHPLQWCWARTRRLCIFSLIPHWEKTLGKQMQTEVIQRIRDQTRFSGAAKVNSRHHTPFSTCYCSSFLLSTKSLGISRTYSGKFLMRPEIWSRESKENIRSSYLFSPLITWVSAF